MNSTMGKAVLGLAALAVTFGACKKEKLIQESSEGTDPTTEKVEESRNYARGAVWRNTAGNGVDSMSVMDSNGKNIAFLVNAEIAKGTDAAASNVTVKKQNGALLTSPMTDTRAYQANSVAVTANKANGDFTAMVGESYTLNLSLASNTGIVTFYNSKSDASNVVKDVNSWTSQIEGTKWKARQIPTPQQ